MRGCGTIFYSREPRRLALSRHRAHVGASIALPTDRPKINVMRPGPWGNPFHIGRDGSREAVCLKFENWLKEQYELLAERHRLRGHDLLCICQEGEPCHGNVWLRVAGMKRDELFDWMLDDHPWSLYTPIRRPC